MSLRLALPLLFVALAVNIASAQSPRVPRPSADPHMSAYSQTGTFEVDYYGTRRDGTECPPSVNALQISINDGKTITGLTSLAMAQETDPAIAALFENTCRVEFDGELWIGIHHGTNGSITPTAARPEKATPRLQGRFTVEYQPLMCVVAPCPPGVYTISDENDQLLGRVDALLIEDASVEPATKSILRGAYPAWRVAEGSLWLDSTTQAEMFQFEAGESRARIHLNTIIEEQAQ